MLSNGCYVLLTDDMSDIIFLMKSRTPPPRRRGFFFFYMFSESMTGVLNCLCSMAWSQYPSPALTTAIWQPVGHCLYCVFCWTAGMKGECRYNVSRILMTQRSVHKKLCNYWWMMMVKRALMFPSAGLNFRHTS